MRRYIPIDPGDDETARHLRGWLLDSETGRIVHPSNVDGDALEDVTVTIDADDRIELYHMLRGRGGSGLKTKLLHALTILAPKYAAKLED